MTYFICDFVFNLDHLGPDSFKQSGCGCGSLRMRVVAVYSSFEICTTGYAVRN